MLRQQSATTHVTNFENTGVGFFSTIEIAREAPPLSNQSPLDAATGSVASIPHGMGFLVFLEDGYVSTIEGYTYAGSTVDLDFETVAFDVKPWSMAGD